MAKDKVIPLDVMFANDKGDVFDFTDVTVRDSCDGKCCYSNSRVLWMLSKIFNKENKVLLLKKISRIDPQHKDNIYGPCKQLRGIDREIAALEKKLAEKRLLRNNIADESKHIKHVNLKNEFKDYLVFN